MCAGGEWGGNLKNNSEDKGRKDVRKKGAQCENEGKRKRRLKGTQGKRRLRPAGRAEEGRPLPGR